MAMDLWTMLSFDYGTVALVVRGDRLCRACFDCTPDDAYVSVTKHYPMAKEATHPVLQEGFQQLMEYFLGNRCHFDLPLDDDRLSVFARRVHKALLQVPYGSVVSYKELARRAGCPGAARAVGGIMAHNPFPLFVPCHRVVNADGSLGKYSAAFGTRTKARLIDLERKLS